MFIAVKVGTGRKIHAGTFTECKKGRHTSRVYISLCSSGTSSFAHNYHSPFIKVDPYSTVKDINCKKCLELMKVS